MRHPDPKEMLIGSQHEQNEFRDLIAEAAKRKIEALRLYEPSPFQDEFHRCRAKERIIQAGNQVGKALRNGTVVLTAGGKWVPIEDLEPGNVVFGSDGSPCSVIGVYPQGVKELYRITFDDGSEIDCCPEHLWKCRVGKERFRGDRRWRVRSTDEILSRHGNRPAQRTDIPLAAPPRCGVSIPRLDPYLVGFLLGDGSLSCGSVQFTTADKEVLEWIHPPDGCEVRKVKSGEYTYSIVSTTPCWGDVSGKSVKSPIIHQLEILGMMGKRAEEKAIPREVFEWEPDERIACLQGLMDTDGTVTKHGIMEFCTVSPHLASGFVELVQSVGGKCKTKWRVTHYYSNGVKKPGRPSARIRVVLPEVNPFRIPRKAKRWRPISRNTTRIIHSIRRVAPGRATCIRVNSPDSTFIAKDYIVTHNSLACFVEDARAVTAQDPYGKYPEKDGVLVCLGLDEAHVGRVIHKYLFRAGAFHIIRDLETGEWRAWKPWNESDLQRVDERKLAPPLVPPRLVKNIAWKKRSTHVFELAEMHNGWTIYAMSSKGEPAAGFQADAVHIDEDIERPEWYDEMIARLSMRDGKLWWSALPLAKNDAMVNVVERAEKEKDDEEPSTVVFRATVYDNPYMPEKSRDENIKRWKAKGEDEYRKRALGEMVIDSVLMYPTFSKDVHGCIRVEPKNEVQAVLTELAGEPPHDWTRYMVVDPGHSVCAVTFWAVPPPDLGEYRVCYDELYLRNCDAGMFGRNVYNKCRDKTFQSFIIDAHGGRLRDIGSGITPRRQYEMQLQEFKIESEDTGFRFQDGSDDIKGRELKLREWLNIRRGGDPTMYVVTERCPNLVWEFGRFRRKVISGVIQDDGNRRGYCHAIETCEYAAAHGLPYVKPTNKSVKSAVYTRIMEGRKRREAQRRASIFGPHSSEGISLGPRGDK